MPFQALHITSQATDATHQKAGTGISVTPDPSVIAATAVAGGPIL